MKNTKITLNKLGRPIENNLTTDKVSNFNYNKNSNNIIPPFLEKVLIGIMLGDGNISRSSITSNSRFEMSFGQNYKEYAETIGKLFIDYVPESSKLIPIKTVELKVKDKVYKNYRFKTASLPVFNKYHSLFYKIKDSNNLNCIEDSISNSTNSNSNRKNSSLRFIKIIPDNILELLDPVVLAYLLMSDGNFDKNRNRVRIYTNSYKKEEVEILSNALNTKFGIYTAVLYDRKDQWIITIGAKQLDALRSIVKPYFHSSMLYRIGE